MLCINEQPIKTCPCADLSDIRIRKPQPTAQLKDIVF
jgi:hypothetical protein